MATSNYDPKKAATFNQLRQQGLSESEAQAQAGITKAEKKSYQINYVGNNDPKSASYNPNYGKVGPQVTGENKAAYEAAIKSGQTEEQAYATLQAKQADYAATNTFQVGDVATNEKTPPNGSVAPQSQTTTPDTISGGGSTTRIAGQKVDTPASNAAQKQADAKQTELDNFYANNPSNAERAMDGLPPLTPAESKARIEKINQLQEETAASQAQANSLKASTPPSTIVTPNTTTSDSTTTFEKTAENTPVSAPAGADPVVNQQAGRQLVNNNVPAGSLTPVPTPVENPQVQPVASVVVATDAPQPVDTGELLTPEQSIARAQGLRLDVPTDDPAAAAADFNARTNQNVQTAIGVPQEVPVEQSLAPGEELVNTSAPEPVPPETFEAGGGGGNQGTITRVTYQPEDVPPTEDPAAGATEAAATGGNESTVNIGTNENRGGNIEAATKQRAQEQAALQAALGQTANGDWRVRIRLALNSNYLYKSADSTSILAPLKASDGVIFPYTPTITTSYNAEYDSTDLTHSNYRGQFYKSSNVGDISINGIFTAQDTAEANYMLAVIHFFRSVTKMFYGQDAERGAPPPLVYLSGFGPYQFNGHPCVVKSFNYSLPNDVDYIRTQPNNYNVNLLNRRVKESVAPSNTIGSVIGRLGNAVDLLGNILKKGALPGGAGSKAGGQPGVSQQAVYNTANATYVPTKIDVQLTLMPIQTRNQVSQQFSLKDYANGSLLRGGFW
jgi:hypothetical protein